MRWAFGIIALCFIACSSATPALPTNPQRIVSLKPNLTEILFAIDAGDRVVGVTKHCVWPEAAKQLPKVGDYAGPDLEKILSLQPDLVVTNKESGSPRFVRVLEKSGIPVLLTETRSLSQIYQAIEQLGAHTQQISAAKQLREKLQKKFTALADQLKKNNAQPTLIVIQDRPLIVAGPNSFISEVLSAVGAHNIVPRSNKGYPRVSMEQVLGWQPEVIVDLDPTAQRAYWQQFTAVPAIKNDRLYFVSPNLFLPGPRIADAAEEIFGRLHQ